MYTVSAEVDGNETCYFARELEDWLAKSTAVDARTYPEGDGSVSVFLDYVTEHEARLAAIEFRNYWPFEFASLVDDGRYIFVFRHA